MDFGLPAGGVVIGIGTDIVECERIAQILERQQQRFLDKVYTAAERDYCMSMHNPVPYLAARFAAKEAVAKCFTTGISEHLGWLSIEIIKGEREQPLVKLNDQGTQLLQKVGASDVLISLSHTRTFATATALLVSDRGLREYLSEP